MPVVPEPKICDSVLDHIGNTPLVRLRKIPQTLGLECEVLVKCEYFNAGGSVKDRIARRMVEEAEKAGILKPGYTIIEPTSGNTGIGLALAAAVKGYRCIITLPEKMSQEKVDILKALGAEIIRTPTEAAWDSPESHIGVAKRLNAEIPNSVILNQYDNPNNPLAHYEGTAEEILEATGGKIDMFVAGAGTGGTLSGTAKKLKKMVPGIQIVGVDPHGSILAQPDTLNTSTASYKVEGIGYDFVPLALDRSVVDEWIKTSDKESFLMSRRLIKEEGLLCGGSSGSALVGAMKAAKGLKKSQRVVIILPDSVRNYMTKFLNDDWMKENGFLPSDVELTGAKIKDLNLPNAVTVEKSTKNRDAVLIMQKNGFDQLPVVSSTSSKRVVGLVTLGNILAKVSSKRTTLESPVSNVMFKFSTGKKFFEVTNETPLEGLSKFFEKNSAAVVTERANENGEEVMKVVSVVTKIDLMAWMVQNMKA